MKTTKKVVSTHTAGGRLKVCSMLMLWGKELFLFKSFVTAVISISTSLNDLVELKRQEIEILQSSRAQ
jgi:hypothetical protein